MSYCSEWVTPARRDVMAIGNGDPQHMQQVGLDLPRGFVRGKVIALSIRPTLGM
jgi:hypothetical protein